MDLALGEVATVVVNTNSLQTDAPFQFVQPVPDVVGIGQVAQASLQCVENFVL